MLGLEHACFRSVQEAAEGIRKSLGAGVGCRSGGGGLR